MLDALERDVATKRMRNTKARWGAQAVLHEFDEALRDTRTNSLASAQCCSSRGLDL